MVNKGRLVKYGVFFICWFFSICIVLTLAANSQLKTFCGRPLRGKSVKSCNFELELPKNQLDAFSYIHFDSKANSRPVYGIAFKKLLLENNNFGPFKTAIHKKAIIHDLHLKYYEYRNGKSIFSTSASLEELIKQTGDILRPSKKYSVGNFNFANVSEVYADKFDCRFFSEDTLLLWVNCRKAAASYRGSNVELRGHVTIKTKDGTVLESNYIEWDVRNNIFNVKGLYVLNHNGAVKTGRSTCFDFTLSEVSSYQAKNHIKEEYRCIAGL
jgi:hypothetical protein